LHKELALLVKYAKNSGIGVYPEMTSYSQNEVFMKIRNDFTLYFRVVPSGKRVVYYYVYDENGKRMYGKSTGEVTMTAARKKCTRAYRSLK
jgi:hypothetical protein